MEKFSRPDRSHYVLDMMPDTVEFTDDTTGKSERLVVIQIWVDPNFRDAHRDPVLREFLANIYDRKEILGLVRYSEREAITLLPPAFTGTGKWVEFNSSYAGPTPILAEEKQTSRMIKMAAIRREMNL